MILVRAANLEFQLGNSREVLRHLAALLSDPMVSSYYDTAFLTYSRLGLPTDQILKSVPQRVEVISKLLIFWTKVGKVKEAVETWKWATARSLANGESTGDFFSFLIIRDQQQAQQLWREYAAIREPGYRNANYIYNPGFERPQQPSPFDWTIENRTSAEASRVPESASNGRWSLQIHFNGEENTDYQQTHQDLVMEPGHYKFSAMMKTHQITTDEGIRIHIFDQPTQARLNVWSETLTGSHNWTKIQTEFDVPSGVKVVRVSVARRPSIKFDNKIGGIAWVDELELSRR